MDSMYLIIPLLQKSLEDKTMSRYSSPHLQHLTPYFVAVQSIMTAYST